MKIRTILAIATMCGVVGLVPADVPIPVPESVFPSIPQPPPTPTPTVDPTAVPVLTEGVFYVVKADAPFLLYASPPGLVTITKEAGPVKLRGVFIDGTGKVQTRTFTQKNLAFVEVVPGAKGRVELIYMPVGTTDESKAVRRLVDVNTAPQPPPKPIDPPVPDPKPVDPKPVDPPVTPVTSFHVVLVYESSATLSPTQTGVLYSKDIADYLTATTTKDGNTAGWRRRDKDALIPNETQTQQTIWSAVKGQLSNVPCLVVEVNGKVNILPFPATVADGLATLKKYAEGK